MGGAINFNSENLFKINKAKGEIGFHVIQNDITSIYLNIRKETEDICKPLEIEDYVVQPCAEVSPPKWHLAHTTWFFEELILAKYLDDYQRYNKGYSYLFNSYYKSVGNHWSQGQRGHLSRPTVKEIYEYRKYVDFYMCEVLTNMDPVSEIEFLLEVGLNHEQQHQELLLMDIKYIFAMNPCNPAYYQYWPLKVFRSRNQWKNVEGGIYQVGFNGQDFSYDNEKPNHERVILSYSVRQQLITNSEYLEFINDGGYEDFRLWPSDGHDWVKENKIKAPLYWSLNDGEWFEYTLGGLGLVDPNASVCHVSYYEAYAFSKWAGYRLPSEFECELGLDEGPHELWNWTSSHYSPYPGYESFLGSLEEYNEKFMCNQFVLRGGCFGTPSNHYRKTYRNFYRPHQRWMFSGIRIAKDK